MTMLGRPKGNRSAISLTEPRGATQLEFVLSILTVTFVIFSIWEAIMAVYTYNVLADAAKEGVRYAIVHGSNSTICSGPKSLPPACKDASGNNVITQVKNFAALSLHDISKITVSPPKYLDSTNEPPNRVRVEVSYNYIPYIAWAMPVIPVLKTAAEGRIVF